MNSLKTLGRNISASTKLWILHKFSRCAPINIRWSISNTETNILTVYIYSSTYLRGCWLFSFVTFTKHACDVKRRCTTFAPATTALVINTNVKHNPNPNPNLNPDPYLNPYPTPNQKPNHYLHSNSLLPEISWQEQLSPEQISDHQKEMLLRQMHQEVFQTLIVQKSKNDYFQTSIT